MQNDNICDNSELALLLGSDEQVVAGLRRIGLLCCIIVAATGLLVLAGWWLHIQRLQGAAPGLVATNPMTAVGVCGCAAAVFVRFIKHPSRVLSAAGPALASLACLLGILRLLNFAGFSPLRVDAILFIHSGAEASHMALLTAACFVLSGLSIVMLSMPGEPAALAAQLLAMSQGAVAMLAFIGYIIRISMLYRMSWVFPKLPTSFCFLLLCIAVLFVRPSRGVMRVVVSRGEPGTLARRLLPAAIIFPALSGWVRLLFQKWGYIDPDLGLPLIVLANTIFFTTLLWSDLARLRAADGRRIEAQEAVKRQNVRLEAAVLAQRQAHQALQETQSQLVQAEKLAALGQMVAGVAHEINNPLSFVSNNVAVLQRDVNAIAELLQWSQEALTAEPQRRQELSQRVSDRAQQIDLPYTLTNLAEMVTRSREGLRRIQQIVKDLRDFARLDRAECDDADINAGVQSTVNIIRGYGRARKVDIKTELGQVPLLRCHVAKINQVVMNLTTNAIDASPSDATVTIRTEPLPSATNAPHPPGVRIRVSDTGTGIPPEVRERMFDPFFTTKPIGQGTGLGLSISYGIVRDHGGSISVESKPGAGSTFTVDLPAVKEDCEPMKSSYAAA